MNNAPHMAVELTSDTLGTVISVFDKMIEDPEAIDFSLHDLTDFKHFENLTARLKEIAKTEEEIVTVPMSQIEWATFTSYAAHAFDLDDDDLTEEEAATMSKVIAMTNQMTAAPQEDEHNLG